MPLFLLPLWLAVTWISAALAAAASRGCGPHVDWRRRLCAAGWVRTLLHPGRRVQGVCQAPTRKRVASKAGLC